jgi:hypothetical protein
LDSFKGLPQKFVPRDLRNTTQYFRQNNRVPDGIRLGHIPNTSQICCRLSPIRLSHATVGCTEELRILESPARYSRDSLSVFIASLLSCIFAQWLRIFPSQPNFIRIIYTNSVPTSQETHYVSTTKNNRLMLFRETINNFFMRIIKKGKAIPVTSREGP